MGIRKYDIANNLKYLRTKQGLTISELSEATGITCAAICQIENKARNPNLSSIIALRKGLGVSFNTLMGDDSVGYGFVPTEIFFENERLYKRVQF